MCGAVLRCWLTPPQVHHLYSHTVLSTYLARLVLRCQLTLPQVHHVDSNRLLSTCLSRLDQIFPSQLRGYFTSTFQTFQFLAIGTFKLYWGKNKKKNVCTCFPLSFFVDIDKNHPHIPKRDPQLPVPHPHLFLGIARPVVYSYTLCTISVLFMFLLNHSIQDEAHLIWASSFQTSILYQP